MKNQQRINWKQGMEITPEIFIESDHYHIAERQMLSALLASRGYGIFPNSKFTIDYELHNNKIEIRIANCIALTKNGDVINIQQNTSFIKELPIDEVSECYAVLSLVHQAQKQTDESELHIVPQYDISFLSTNELIENGIPVLKLLKQNSAWEIDAHYIPPAIALNALHSLTNKFIEIKDIIKKIIGCYPEKDAHYLTLMMLQIELNNFSSKESPETLIMMMKKFCFIFQTFLKNVKEMEPLQSVKTFMDILYNPNEIEKTLVQGLQSLMEILKIFEVAPAPEIEEIKV